MYSLLLYLPNTALSSYRKKEPGSSKYCLSRQHPSKTTALNYVLGEISSVPSTLEKCRGSHEKQNQGTSAPLEKWGTREGFKNERILMLIINAGTGTSKIGVEEGVPGRSWTKPRSWRHPGVDPQCEHHDGADRRSSWGGEQDPKHRACLPLSCKIQSYQATAGFTEVIWLIMMDVRVPRLEDKLTDSG